MSTEQNLNATTLEAEVDLDTAVDQLDVEVVDDTPEDDKGRRALAAPLNEPTEAELANYSEDVKKRINELTHARHDERRRADKVAREAKELEEFSRRLMEENKQLKKSHNSNQEVMVSSARGAAEADLVAARVALKAAHDAFDTDAIVEAQEKLAEAKMRHESLKNYRPTPLQDDEDEVQSPQAQQRAPQVDPKTLSWRAKNQWFGVDEEATGFALAVHKRLIASGYDPRSDEYYAHIDARMKDKFPEVVDPENVVRTPRTSEARRPQATVVAPAARTTGPRKIVLTTSQQAIAKRLGLTNQQYAAQVAKLENQ